MFEKWRELLTADNAVGLMATDSIDELADYTSAAGVQICALSSSVIYEITGTDAQSFLQGQFCNDIAQVSVSQAQITGYCTPKGRLLALPLIVGFDGGYRLLVPSNVAEAFIKRLSMFVMRSDVKISLLSDWVAVGVSLSDNQELGALGQLASELPGATLSVSSAPDAQLIRWHDDHSGAQVRSRYLRLASVDSQVEFCSAFNSADKRSHNIWRLGDISAAIPSVTQDVVEAFVPQMINLHLINGLSFTKGCYPGQEIVARMQYLGKLKRHMRIFSLPLEATGPDVIHMLRPGSALSQGSDENAGVVVDAMPAGQEAALVLAVTKVAANDAPITLADVELTPVEMPYELPSLEVDKDTSCP